jgi:hypothetical protein
VVDLGLTLVVLLALGDSGPKGPTPPAPPAAPTVTAPDAPAPGAPAVGAKPPERKAAPRPTKSPDNTKAGRSVPVDRSDKVPPPATSASALHQELRASGGSEDHSLASERARLELLAIEIGKARESLKQETARLQAMLKGGGEPRPSPAGGEPRAPSGELETAPGVPFGSGASRDVMREQIISVSRSMKGMKPEQAAAIVAHLDRVLAAEILRRMRPADAGLVLAQLKPDLAADLATTIAIRKPMVDDGPKKDRK